MTCLFNIPGLILRSLFDIPCSRYEMSIQYQDPNEHNVTFVTMLRRSSTYRLCIQCTGIEKWMEIFCLRCSPLCMPCLQLTLVHFGD